MRERERECFRDVEPDRVVPILLFPRAEDDEDREDESLDSVSETGEIGADDAGDGSIEREDNEEAFLTED